MRKIYYIVILLTILIVSLLGITYSLDYTGHGELSFELIGPSLLYIDVNSEYTEYGVKVNLNGMDISDKVKIDSSSVNTSVIGSYKVKYEVDEEYIYRDVKVIDKEEPVIKLLSGNEISLLKGGSYDEAGYIVTDNYDTDLNDKVIVDGSVNTDREGEYKITYTVSDSSGNKTSTERNVKVIEPIINVGNEWENKIVNTETNAYMYSNTVTRNKFTDDGVYYEGYTSGYSNSYIIKLKSRNNKTEYTYNMNSNGGYNYNGNIKLDSIDNGVYDVYIIGSKEERLVNKLNIYSRIVRAKVGAKLVTFTYDNDLVSIVVENFEYKYDFFIDPGHGGSDTGAANGIVIEKDLNLKISKY